MNCGRHDASLFLSRPWLVVWYVIATNRPNALPREELSIYPILVLFNSYEYIPANLPSSAIKGYW